MPVPQVWLTTTLTVEGCRRNGDARWRIQGGYGKGEAPRSLKNFGGLFLKVVVKKVEGRKKKESKKRGVRPGKELGEVWALFFFFSQVRVSYARLVGQ